MKKIIIISIWVLLIAGTGVLLGFVSIEKQKGVCQGVIVTIHRSSGDVLITQNELLDLVQTKAKPLRGQKIDMINPREIESAIRKCPYIIDAEVYVIMNGMVMITATQREPILRVFNTHNERFYIDKNGALFQSNPLHPTRVLVASGSINARFKQGQNLNLLPDSLKTKSVLYGLYQLSSTINQLNYIKPLAGQLFVTEKFNYELFTNTGQHTIILGDAHDLENKFNRLYWFYKKAISQVGWERYSTINLSYNNQVVCTKK
jgi:cell division protein FtsQ